MTTDPGYIYLIKSLILGGYKIGKTINPDQRFSQLEVPKKATVVACWSVNQMSMLEKSLHKTFKSARVPQSEWFDLSLPNLKSLCTAMSLNFDPVFTSDEYKSYLPEQVDKIPTPVVSTPTVKTVSNPVNVPSVNSYISSTPQPNKVWKYVKAIVIIYSGLYLLGSVVTSFEKQPSSTPPSIERQY